MKGLLLKSYLFSSLLLMVSFAAQAQDFHFIYIETENQKPFYVRIDGQTIPSSSSGYIIIPRLTQGEYKSYIGFPKTELAELVFNFVINDADAGYFIKEDIDQGLYMVDLQTMKFVPTEMRWPVVKNTIKSKDEFARILAEVVNDSSINEIAVFTKPVEVLVKSEANETNTLKAVEPKVVIDDTPQVIVDSKVVISKLEQKNTSGGLSVTYTDDADTIDVFIPVNTIQTKTEKEEKSEPLIVAKKQEEAVKDVKFINMELQNPNQQTDSGVIKKDDFVITQKKNAINSDADIKQKDSVVELKTPLMKPVSKCKKTAAQTDFLNLRKKMAAQKSEADMRMLAGKQFNSTCFTTEQIKNLGVLFITEEERYKFYVSAYSYVADVENFAILEQQLADSFYVDRFKAMLNH